MRSTGFTKQWITALIVLFAALPLAAQTPPIPLPAPAPAIVMPPGTTPFVAYSQKPLAGNDILNALQVAPGVWWNDEAMVARLGLTNEQRRKMDEILQQFRLQLIDLNAAVDKEELVLEPLLAAPTLDEAKIVAQIDRIAAARAELEKANARLLLGLQQTLTAEQRAKLPRNTSWSRGVNSYKFN